MDDTDFARASAAGEAVFIFGSIAMQRGGVTRAILSRMRLFSDAGIKVRLLLTGHHHHEVREEAEIRKAWAMPDSVEIRYLWREVAPGGAGGPVDPLAADRHEPGMTAFSENVKTGELVRFYRDGLLVKTKHFTDDGRIEQIEHHDAARRCVSRAYFEGKGRLVYIDEMNVNTGKPALRRWFDRSGECWLTTWMTASGNPAATLRHGVETVAYDNFGQFVARWVDEVLADAVAPVIFSDSRGQDPVLLALAHPTLRTVAVMHNCHTKEPFTAHDPTKLYWLPLLENLDSFDMVVSLTHQQRDDVASRYGGSRHTVINHPTPPVEDVRVDRQPGRLVAVARFAHQKRLDDAIRAFALAAPRVPGASFDIYGSGAEAAKLRALVRSLDMTDRIQFRGFTHRALEAFAGATATVLSSRFEGFPLVINEAMGVGTPFVAYDINYGPAEVIRHEVDGLLVPPGDVQALSEAMVRVLGDPDYGAQLGERAREVTERFSTRRWGEEWIGLFTDLVTRTLSAQNVTR